MKYKLLSVGSKLPASFLNIGDFIQAVASSQFLPQIDGFIDREQIKQYDGDDCKVIMNGWFMHFDEGWPPSRKIHPLFVAFHINSTATSWLLSSDSISYLKKYEPIGCRDMQTCALLKEKGIDAYFSGCMTLTLGCKYLSQKKDNLIYIVDPYYKYSKSLFHAILNLFHIIIYYKNVKSIAAKFDCCWWCNPKSFKRLFFTSYFYCQYRQLFAKDLLLNAIYVCQENDSYKSLKTDEKRFDIAQKLIENYSHARMVITSRIHCALPCLGLETPVIFVENKEQSETSACRLSGLSELFNIINSKNGHLTPTFKTTMPINSNTIIKNKQNWHTLSDKLILRCTDFFK